MRLTGYLLIITLVFAAAIPAGAQEKALPSPRSRRVSFMLYGRAIRQYLSTPPGIRYRDLVWSPMGHR
jgi:hypothetical protein